MGVAAAYLGELVTDELKAMAAEDNASISGAAGGAGRGAEGDEPTRIVVVAPQEGQVRSRD